MTDGLNVDWALGQLRKFEQMTVMRNGSGNGFFTTSDYTSSSDVEVTREAPVIEAILDRVIVDWRTSVPFESSNRWTRHREATLRAITHLEREAELRANLGDNAPSLSASGFHPWAWEGARSLWQSGHYAEAIGAASRKINAETQNKVGRRDISEESLFKEAFSTNAPEVGKARLRLMNDDGGKTFSNVHRGAMALAEGLFAAVRNRIAHEDGMELPEQEALELLASWSVLARWVSEAEVAVQ
jgi:hypothetical protein